MLADGIQMMLPQFGQIERKTVGPHAAARITIEGSEKASLRNMRFLLAQHPVGVRILHAAREAAVDDFLSDAAVAAAASLPPSKEAAVELRELFARAHCLRQLAEFGVDAQAPASRRAIDAIVASWDWDLSRVERCVERLVVAAAGAGVLAEGDMGFINFLLARRECREASLSSPPNQPPPQPPPPNPSPPPAARSDGPIAALHHRPLFHPRAAFAGATRRGRARRADPRARRRARRRAGRVQQEGVEWWNARARSASGGAAGLKAGPAQRTSRRSWPGGWPGPGPVGGGGGRARGRAGSRRRERTVAAPGGSPQRAAFLAQRAAAGQLGVLPSTAAMPPTKRRGPLSLHPSPHNPAGGGAGARQLSVCGGGGGRGAAPERGVLASRRV